MKRYLIIVIVLTLIISGCSQEKQATDAEETANQQTINEETTNTQIANPASEFCIENYGKLEIRTAPDGSQTGYCIFDNGKECDEWEYFRGECSAE